MVSDKANNNREIPQGWQVLSRTPRGGLAPEASLSRVKYFSLRHRIEKLNMENGDVEGKG
jgi:hypothetical protein